MMAGLGYGGAPPQYFGMAGGERELVAAGPHHAPMEEI